MLNPPRIPVSDFAFPAGWAACNHPFAGCGEAKAAKDAHCYSNFITAFIVVKKKPPSSASGPKVSVSK